MVPNKSSFLDAIRQSEPMPSHALPYRNLRHLLSLHASATPDAPYISHIAASGERTALTYAQFNGAVHQCAGFLYDELGVRHDDPVALLTPNSPQLPILIYACWLFGAIPVPLEPSTDNAHLSQQLGISAPVVCFAHAAEQPRIAALVPPALPIIDVESLPSLIAQRPNTFIATHQRPTLSDAALLIFDDARPTSGVILAQENLLVTAAALAQANAFSGRQCLLSQLSLTTIDGILFGLLVPLIAGASSILHAQVSGIDWACVAHDRAHIIACNAEHIRNATPDGAVAKHQLRHLRHVLCSARGLSAADLLAFEETFAIMILSYHGAQEASGIYAQMPIDHDWAAHRRWRAKDDALGIGCPLPHMHVTILEKDTQASLALFDGQGGALALSGRGLLLGYASNDDHPDINIYLRTTDIGSYERDEHLRPFFFVNTPQTT
jgi:fatty-acyl-CoA synthase